MSENKHLIISEDLLSALAAVSGREPDMQSDDRSFPVSDEILENRAEMKKRRRDEGFKNIRPGDWVEGEGIFVCQYEPLDKNYIGIGKRFNVFAARHDLRGEDDKEAFFTYNEALERLRNLKNLDGYNGAAYEDEWLLYSALKDGTYKEEWVIPPRTVLSNANEDIDCITKYQNTGAFKGTIRDCLDIRCEGGFSAFYWSCDVSRYHENTVYASTISDVFSGVFSGSWERKDHKRMSCRPVRFVEAL